jgi:hypothetical protein
MGKAENAAEAADVGNDEATISSEHPSSSPKERCHVEMDSQK